MLTAALAAEPPRDDACEWNAAEWGSFASDGAATRPQVSEREVSAMLVRNQERLDENSRACSARQGSLAPAGS